MVSLESEVDTYEPTMREKNPAWGVRDGTVCLSNDVERSKREVGSCVVEGIGNLKNAERHGLEIMRLEKKQSSRKSCKELEKYLNVSDQGGLQVGDVSGQVLTCVTWAHRSFEKLRSNGNAVNSTLTAQGKASNMI